MVCDEVVCVSVVCERWYVTKLCVCECVEEEAGGGGGEATRDRESKARTPHKVVGKKKER